MGRGVRAAVILMIVLLLAGIGGMVFAVSSRMQTNEYLFRIEASFSAAAVANGGEPLTDPAVSVVSEWEQKRWTVVPGNYKALLAWLKREPGHPLFFSMDTGRALKLVFCDSDVLYAAPANDTGEQVLIRLETGGQVFTMRIHGGKLWDSLLAAATEGTYHDDNLPVP